MSAVNDELTVTEAMKLAGTDATVLAERLFNPLRDQVTASGRIIPGPSLWPTALKPRRVRRGRWVWLVVDQATGATLARGWAWTQTGAWTKSDRAAQRIYGQRLEVLRAAEDEKGCE